MFFEAFIVNGIQELHDLLVSLVQYSVYLLKDQLSVRLPYLEIFPLFSQYLDHLSGHS